jgi:hypothetical protein
MKKILFEQNHPLQNQELPKGSSCAGLLRETFRPKRSRRIDRGQNYVLSVKLLRRAGAGVVITGNEVYRGLIQDPVVLSGVIIAGFYLI